MSQGSPEFLICRSPGWSSFTLSLPTTVTTSKQLTISQQHLPPVRRPCMSLPFPNLSNPPALRVHCNRQCFSETSYIVVPSVFQRPDSFSSSLSLSANCYFNEPTATIFFSDGFLLTLTVVSSSGVDSYTIPVCGEFV